MVLDVGDISTPMKKKSKKVLGELESLLCTNFSLLRIRHVDEHG